MVRPCPTYGPYQSAYRPLPRFITSVLRGEPAPTPGNGARFGDWLHVADLCAALDRLWRYGRTGEIYHVSAGCPRSGLDLTQAVLAAAGRPRLPLRTEGPQVDLRTHAVLDGTWSPPATDGSGRDRDRAVTLIITFHDLELR